MVCKVVKDPDNTWYTYIDWSDWFDRQIADIGGTFTLTVSDWFPASALTEEGDTFSNSTKQTAFFGSGGTDGEEYQLLNRISYTSSTLGTQVFTEDRTITIRIKEK